MARDAAQIISSGRTVLGMELGSTRIKAVLMGTKNEPLAVGSHGWENQLVDNVWTYSLEQIWEGVAACFASLKADVSSQHGVELTSVSMMGVSGMMHGYLAFDANGELLTPFRTWRNNITGEASRELTELLGYPVPQRWSVAHLHQAILDGKEHVAQIRFLTTLSGYVHWKLTGERVLGAGDASGMFPVSPDPLGFDASRIRTYDSHIAGRSYNWTLAEILPQVVPAGEIAGRLTTEGAKLLDPSGGLEPGVPLCPPEGDAGTGMVATNSVRVRTGNVSAGTSVFAMLVMEQEPSRVHEEIDLVTTPDGSLVGMVHSNNCTTDIDAWVSLLGEAAQALGASFSPDALYATLLGKALEAAPDAGGLLAYGYVSGEHITGFSEGRPLFVRHPDADLSLANFMRAHLFTALCALRTGLDILMDKEGVTVDEIRGHGGFFKTEAVGRRIMAAATRTPVSLLATSGEGGAYGMALLAAFALREERSTTLPEFLDAALADAVGPALAPDQNDMKGFDEFYARYHRGITIERAAVEAL